MAKRRRKRARRPTRRAYVKPHYRRVQGKKVRVRGHFRKKRRK